MPAIKHYTISQTKEIKISGVDILEVAALARRIFDGEATKSGDTTNMILSPVIERELKLERNDSAA